MKKVETEMKYSLESLDATQVVKLTPLTGMTVGGISVKFGMERDKVRSVLKQFKEFKKTEASPNSADDFGFCHIFYDKDNKLQAIEVFDGKIDVGGILVKPRDLVDVIKDIMSKASKKFVIENDGFYDYERSIGIGVSGSKVDSVLIGSKGYYK